MEATDTSLSQDIVFELLSSPRRRYILYHLRQTNEPVELTTLAEQVAAWENETDVDNITEQERKRVYVSLYQTHIPRLDEAGVIVYDKDSGMVSLSSQAKEIDNYLDSTEETFSWQWGYLLLAVVSGTVLGLTVAQVGFFESLSESLVAAAILVAFSVTALSHTIYRLLQRRSVPEELNQRL
jgi:DNA-binding transcriptional ArsR family regulator